MYSSSSQVIQCILVLFSFLENLNSSLSMSKTLCVSVRVSVCLSVGRSVGAAVDAHTRQKKKHLCTALAELWMPLTRTHKKNHLYSMTPRSSLSTPVLFFFILLCKILNTSYHNSIIYNININIVFIKSNCHWPLVLLCQCHVFVFVCHITL
jgi:hypothetical protein